MRHTTLILSLTLLLASCASVFTAPDQRETSYETVAPDGAILIEPNIRIELDGNVSSIVAVSPRLAWLPYKEPAAGRA